MKIVTLMENTSCGENLHAEHGLSLLIETRNRKILFDAGQSAAFVKNAGTLGLDLQEVDFAVLSHGHYDHSGGLGAFLEINSHTPVYVSNFAFEPHYNAAGKYLGVDPSLENHPQIRYVAQDTVLEPGISLHRLETAPSDTAGLLVEELGQRKPDDFRHEQYLLLEEKGKRILISGCSHKGILNIAEAFQPDILIGGFHFMKITDEKQLEAAAKKLLEYNTIYYTGHCTGLEQYHYLKTRMDGKLHYIATGTVLEL